MTLVSFRFFSCVKLAKVIFLLFTNHTRTHTQMCSVNNWLSESVWILFSFDFFWLIICIENTNKHISFKHTLTQTTIFIIAEKFHQKINRENKEKETQQLRYIRKSITKRWIKRQTIINSKWKTKQNVTEKKC